MFYFKFKDKECSLKIKLIQDLFGILYLDDKLGQRK